MACAESEAAYKHKAGAGVSKAGEPWLCFAVARPAATELPAPCPSQRTHPCQNAIPKTSAPAPDPPAHRLSASPQRCWRLPPWGARPGGTGGVPPPCPRRRRKWRRRRSEEHTSELQSPCNLVCRLLLGKK